MKIFIGYDPRESEAFDVCKYSIQKHEPSAEIIKLDRKNLSCYTRPDDNLSSTEFTFTRFLIPYLMNYEGTAIFVDCDFIFTTSISPLYHINSAVRVVKQDYKPNSAIKMDGKVQTIYERKNWSSLIVYNCSHIKNKILTPELINTCAGLFLHQFRWLDDSDIGELDPRWNHLVGWSKNTIPLGIHFTEGGPWLDTCKNCDYSDLWLNYREEYIKNKGQVV